jgi:hypothetical protein
VCRRLTLVEALETSVQADVRLGLLSARAAVLVSALPRGNQVLAAGVVIGRGLTVRQTALLVRDLLDAAGPDAQSAVLRRLAEEQCRPVGPGLRATRGVVETITRDVTTIRRSAGRLQSCLVSTPLTAFESRASDLIRQSLGDLQGVLGALEHTIDRTLTQSAAAEGT